MRFMELLMELSHPVYILWFGISAVATWAHFTIETKSESTQTKERLKNAHLVVLCCLYCKESRTCDRRQRDIEQSVYLQAVSSTRNTSLSPLRCRHWPRPHCCRTEAAVKGSTVSVCYYIPATSVETKEMDHAYIMCIKNIWKTRDINLI